MKSSEDQKQAARLLRLAGGGAIGVVLLWCGSGVALYWMPERGTFGDMFGAVNALFSGLAFLGVILAIVLQYEELKEQRREIQQSRVAQEESAKALTAQLRTADIRSRVESLNLLIEAQVRILARLEERRTVAESERRIQLRLRIAQYEQELEYILDKEIKRHEENLL